MTTPPVASRQIITSLPALLALLALLLLGSGGCGEDDPDPVPPTPGRVWHATPGGAGSDCGSAQECLDGAVAGDTVEFAAGVYDQVTDTLVAGGDGLLVRVNLTARNGVVLRAAPGADVRVNGQADEGRIGLHLADGTDSVTVIGLRFDNCGAGVRAVGGFLRLVDCRFVGGTRGLVTDGTDLDIRGCRFEEYAGDAVLVRDAGGRLADSEFWGNNYGMFIAQGRDFLVENSLVGFCCLTGVRVEEGGSAIFRNVTVTGVGMVPDDSTGIVVAGGAHAELVRCVIAGNRGYGLHARAGGTADVACSDLFGNSSGAYFGLPDPTGQDGNLAVDPLFCSPPDLDFHLQPASPARTAACGAMGAFSGEGCRPRSASDSAARLPWRRGPG